jgi:hypothetical protein
VGWQFQDARHGRRLRQLLEQLSGRGGATTPWASQDWANTKAAYRFFGNDRISEANILAGHFASTRERFAARGGFPILVLQDTTEISFKREDGREVSNALRQPGATSISHQLRHIDAFQPGGYSQWFAAGTGGDQVLEQR